MNYRFIDLSQKLSAEAPTWNGSCGFCLEVKKDYEQVFRVHQIKMHAGVGTHMDAPCHRFVGGASIGDISLDELIVPVCIIDVSKKAEADFVLTVEDIQHNEKEYGTIASKSLVLVYTGWSRFWDDAKAYRNEDEKGQMHFPAISGNAAEMLCSRNVVGLGIDTLSPDCLDFAFPVHQIFLGSGKYIIENVANCSQMPPRGGFCLALPIRAEGASEAPIRLVGLV